jgi:hypothetical protein
VKIQDGEHEKEQMMRTKNPPIPEFLAGHPRFSGRKGAGIYIYTYIHTAIIPITLTIVLPTKTRPSSAR